MSQINFVMESVFNTLIQDEKLLRLLYYPPKNAMKGILDPLDTTLEDITKKDTVDYWDIVDNHILLTSKVDDFQDTPICRIYLYQGKTRPTFRNMRTTKIEIVLDVFVHKKYDIDLRLQQISDRLSKVLFLSRANRGLGRVDYRTGYDFVAPLNYQAYRHIYEVGGTR